jgi:hypothetical protein
MKKFFMAIVCLMTMVLFSSCASTYSVTANYDVCYPDGTRNYNESVVVSSTGSPSVFCYSYDGTNYVSVIAGTVETSTSHYGGYVSAKTVKKAQHFVSTTAPTRLNDYVVHKISKKRSRYEDVYNK